MKFQLTIVIACFVFLLHGQQKGVTPIAKADNKQTGITRAVIVGISDYQNKNITDLQFADRDAQVFANYLLSKDGANVDNANITLLLNEKATAGQFVSALYGLMEESKEGDLALIYFSGHGDVESITINQPGFLLCWDSPSKVYMGGGTFGLVYLQEIISTLSLRNKARVIVITDACRSGKLAGSEIGGAQATAANLSKQYANEAKILSCQPNEFALEGLSWGGGRGVFSYYLMAGIQGLADKNNDNEVSLYEVGRYLEDNVTKSVAPHNQTPMIVGDRNSKISVFNPQIQTSLRNEILKENFDYVAERAMSPANLNFSDSTVYKKYVAFHEALENGHLLYPMEGSAWTLFQEIKDAVDLKNYAGLMRRNLAASLQDDAQQAINDYLASDSKELYNRWTYSAKYSKFPEELNKAAELLGPNHFFYKSLISRALYFEGLNLRLEGEKSNHPHLFESALTLQDSSLRFEANAAYALNEKGYTFFLSKKYKESIAQYEAALTIAPTWALVWSNLCGSYNETKEFEKAILAGKKALTYDATLLSAINNLAISYYKLKQYGTAREIIHRGINVDSKYANYYSILGLIEFQEKKYDEAEIAMLKCYELDSMQISTCIDLGQIYLKKADFNSSKKYFQRARVIDPQSEIAFQGMIEFYFYTNDFDNASLELEKYVQKYPEDNFALYLIASISAGKANEDKCLQFLEMAFDKGFKETDVLLGDANFSKIATTEKYQRLVKRYFKE